MMHSLIRALGMLRTRTALAMLLGAMGASGVLPLAPHAAGQDDDPAVLLPAPESEVTLITRKAVDVLSRIALLNLRSVANPSRENLRAAALELRIVRRLAPDDANLLRLEIEAWSSAGDDDEALAGARELLRLDPADQIAQLRVTIAGLDQLQNVDARLQAYDRLLGPRGQVVNAAVRSRLALDAALLARDNGDDKAFLHYLTTAMSLDPTNKGAAALFGSYVLGKSEDPMQRVEVLCNIILADPLDAGAYENLALELLSRGAFIGALRAYQIGTQIAVAAGWTMTPERVFDLALCDWRVRGPLPALGRINKVLQDSMNAEAARRARREAEGLPLGPEKTLYLPPELDLLRLAIAVSQQNEEGVKTVLDAYLTAGALQIDQLESKPGNTPQERLRTKMILEAVKLQHLWAMLFARERPDEAETLLEEILAENADRAGADADSATAPDDASDASPTPSESTEAQAPAETDADNTSLADGADSTPDQAGRGLPPLQPEVIQRFRGWLAMVQGRDRDAEELLTPLMDTDVNARWAMAVLREQQGNSREAMLNFALVAMGNPRSALSAAAWYRLMALRGEAIAPPKEVQALDRYVVDFAPWLNTFAVDPSSFMTLLVSHEEPVIDALGVIKVDVTVRNISPWPLAVGVGRPIPKRLMLAPRLRLKGKDATELTEPAVALIQKRLRLEPAEEVTVVVSPTRGRLGTLLDNTPGALASLRWQAVQGFTTTADGGYRAGAMTVTTLSDVVVRQSLDDTIETSQLVGRIDTLEGADLLRAIQIARRRIVDSRVEDEDPQTARTLADAIIARLPSMDPLSQAIVLGWFGESGIGVDDEFTAPLRAAMADPSTYPALALLMAFVTEQDDPLLQRLIASQDDDLSRLAFITREVLRSQAGDGAPAPTSAEAPQR
jgi:tetratricopeptide (TPR) repeat protein